MSYVCETKTYLVFVLKAQLLVCQEPMEAGVLVLGGLELVEVSLQAVDRPFLAPVPGLVKEVGLQVFCQGVVLLGSLVFLGMLILVAQIFWGMLILVHGGLEVTKFFELVGLLHDLIENLPKQNGLLFGVSKTHVHLQGISRFGQP